jgi:exopolysaccharide production protein ExoZ
MKKNHEIFTGLQVARGIAALFVVLFHTNLGSVFFYGKTAFSGFWEFGIIGVDFFFVLSGFIIYWVHSEDKRNFESSLLYLKKRIIRIYPPFILISTILLISYKFFPNLSAANRNIGIITSILLLPTPPLDPALTISWTLMHQMMFYIIFITIYIKKTLFHITCILWGLLILFYSFIPFEGIMKTFFSIHTTYNSSLE